jgi:type VI protein secretion system component Hcp
MNASRNLMAGGAAQQSQQRVTGSTTLGPIMLLKNVDKADPKLLAACLGGKIVKKVVIVETVTIGGKSEINSQYELADVLVTSIVTAGDGKSNQ